MCFLWVRILHIKNCIFKVVVSDLFLSLKCTAFLHSSLLGLYGSSVTGQFRANGGQQFIHLLSTQPKILMMVLAVHLSHKVIKIPLLSPSLVEGICLLFPLCSYSSRRRNVSSPANVHCISF